MRKNICRFLGFLVLCCGLVGVVFAGQTSSITYQTPVGVNFSFNPRLVITLSSADLIIPNLAPGSSADSNTITVTVNTNTAYGYTLNATVGQATNYETRNLIKSGTEANFSSIAYGSSLASLSTDNTWGYAYKPSGNGSSWTTYSGLPLYSDTTNVATLISTDDPADSDSVEFKIAAKASTTQPAGEYKNVINFVAISNPAPLTLEGAYEAAGKTKLNGYYKMQDMNTSICNAVEVEDDELQVIDTRDNKVYWIAKLKDGHCWMTQNLDLDLGATTLTHNSTTLYHDDTDLGWGSDIITTSWTPANATIEVIYDSNMNGTFSSMGTSATDYNVPKSLNVGDWYFAGYNGTVLSTPVNYLTSSNRITTNGVTVVKDNNNKDYFSNHPFSGTGTSNNGTHGHVGNYYNWSAAIASNNSSSYTSSTVNNVNNNPQNSICPAGWRLPFITGYDVDPTYSNSGSLNEFARLAYLYSNYTGIDGFSNYSPYGLEDSPLYFVQGGKIEGSSLLDPGSAGYYWSSSVGTSLSSNLLFINYGTTDPVSGGSRYYGASIRCVAR